MKKETKKNITAGIILALIIIVLCSVTYHLLTYDTNEPQFNDICKELGYKQLTDYY